MAQAILVGRAGSPGVGLGRLLPVGSGGSTPSPSAPSDGLGPSQERDRLLAALATAAAELEALAQRTAERAGVEVGAIFEAQALFAKDPGIVEPALALVDSGVAADVAITRATDAQADALAAVDDDYFRERAADVRDVGRRVAALVRGEARPDLWHPDGSPAILVAHDLEPSAVATLRPELVAGIALAGGAPTGHTAIVARALAIPLVLGLGGAIDDVTPAAAAAVDGSAGRLLIEPSPADLAMLAPVGNASVGAPGGAPSQGSGRARIASPEEILSVTVAANVGSIREAESAAAAGADGIGLVRTELVFMGRSAPPTDGEQRVTYARILATMPDHPVVFRTLDVGGDKPAAWQATGVPESNPALGVRGLRLGLRRPDLFDGQLRALLEASAGRELRVMLPMVSTRDELDLARRRLIRLHEEATVAGRAGPTSILLGVMIEVPAAAIMADALAEVADFFSIGTNDLVQYTLAADRTNHDLADLATALQPAVLRLIDGVVRAAAKRSRHVAVCGEAAADPDVVPLLVGLGVRTLSVTPGSIASVRERVASLQAAACRTLAERALAAGTVAEVRSILDQVPAG